MALLQTKYCFECCAERAFYNGKCAVCEAKEKEREHREHFLRLDSMTLEERVRNIEKQLYVLQKNPPWIEPTY